MGLKKLNRLKQGIGKNKEMVNVSERTEGGGGGVDCVGKFWEMSVRVICVPLPRNTILRSF